MQNSSDPTPSSTSDTVPNTTAPTNSPAITSPPAPGPITPQQNTTTLAIFQPKHTICILVPNNNDRYTVTSYKPHKCADKHARITAVDTVGNLHTYAEAMACPDTAQWELTCNNKCCAFNSMGVYEIVPHPKDCKVVGSKWVFRIKHKPNSSSPNVSHKSKALTMMRCLLLSQNLLPCVRSWPLPPNTTLKYIKWMSSPLTLWQTYQ